MTAVASATTAADDTTDVSAHVIANVTATMASGVLAGVHGFRASESTLELPAFDLHLGWLLAAVATAGLCWLALHLARISDFTALWWWLTSAAAGIATIVLLGTWTARLLGPHAPVVAWSGLGLLALAGGAYALAAERR